MTVLYLTNNPQLAGTARILTSWLRLGREGGIGGCVAVQAGGQLVEWLQEEGVPHVVTPMRWPNRRWPWAAVSEAWRLARWARRRRVSLVHCNEHDVYPFALLLRTFLQVPLVCHVRFKLDRGFSTWAFRGRRCPDALLWTTNQQRADSADAVRGVVPDERQHLIRLGPDLRTFGVQGLDRHELRRCFDLEAEDIVIGTACALRPIKRLHDFVRIIRRLSSDYPSVVGLIAGAPVLGDEAYREQLENSIADAALGRRLRWLGHLEPIEPFLGALDIFVSTSEYETFGNSVCEAMACGLPVAAYQGGSVQEVLGDSGFVVPTGDQGLLTEAIGRLVRSAEERERLGQAGRYRVGRYFDPRVSHQALSHIYADLLRR